mmetsp:Transcript_35651/g.69855  ORF Transcript_35651/g.69855 Transcript_35651/m.69855 type:complete len:114 (+) Transcript_35651:95-436(+)
MVLVAPARGDDPAMEAVVKMVLMMRDDDEELDDDDDELDVVVSGGGVAAPSKMHFDPCRLNPCTHAHAERSELPAGDEACLGHSTLLPIPEHVYPSGQLAHCTPPAPVTWFVS